MTRSWRSLRQDSKGVATLEFTLVGSTFMLLIVFTIETGMVFWIKNAFEVAASQTARCLANSGTACSNSRTYAQSLLDTWGVNALVPQFNITVTPGASCSRTVGTYTSVTINTTTDLAWLIPPLNTIVLTSTACYPVKA